MARHSAAVLSAAIALGVLSAHAAERPAAPAPAASVQTIDWKDLVPPGYDADTLIRQFRKEAATLTDNDPRARQLQEKYQKLWEEAPVVKALHDKTVKLSGFLVTLEANPAAVSEFLLVPYFGACIHVPPPPSNQIVLVRAGAKPFKVTQNFQTVSVTGRLKTEASQNDLARTSYVIEATQIEARAP
jgi:hypothetical protein